MNSSKVKKFTRAKSIDPGKAEEFIKGAEAAKEQEVNISNAEDEKLDLNEENSTPAKDLKPPSSEKAEKPTNSKIKKYPWEDANERVIKGVNLRLTEVQWTKLRYIVDRTPYSMQKYIMSLLEPAMEVSIKTIQKNLK